jgi:hypothetical protein
MAVVNTSSPAMISVHSLTDLLVVISTEPQP